MKNKKFVDLKKFLIIGGLSIIVYRIIKIVLYSIFTVFYINDVFTISSFNFFIADSIIWIIISLIIVKITFNILRKPKNQFLMFYPFYFVFGFLFIQTLTHLVVIYFNNLNFDYNSLIPGIDLLAVLAFFLYQYFIKKRRF